MGDRPDIDKTSRLLRLINGDSEWAGREAQDTAAFARRFTENAQDLPLPPHRPPSQKIGVDPPSRSPGRPARRVLSISSSRILEGRAGWHLQILRESDSVTHTHIG